MASVRETYPDGLDAAFVRGFDGENEKEPLTLRTGCGCLVDLGFTNRPVSSVTQITLL
jgi:hypothetical protein